MVESLPSDIAEAVVTTMRGSGRPNFLARPKQKGTLADWTERVNRIGITDCDWAVRETRAWEAQVAAAKGRVKPLDLHDRLRTAWRARRGERADSFAMQQANLVWAIVGHVPPDVLRGYAENPKDKALIQRMGEARNERTKTLARWVWRVLVDGEPPDDSWRDVARELGVRQDMHPQWGYVQHYLPVDLAWQFAAARQERADGKAINDILAKRLREAWESAYGEDAQDLRELESFAEPVAEVEQSPALPWNEERDDDVPF